MSSHSKARRKTRDGGTENGGGETRRVGGGLDVVGIVGEIAQGIVRKEILQRKARLAPISAHRNHSPLFLIRETAYSSARCS